LFREGRCDWWAGPCRGGVGVRRGGGGGLGGGGGATD